MNHINTDTENRNEREAREGKPNSSVLTNEQRDAETKKEEARVREAQK